MMSSGRWRLFCHDVQETKMGMDGVLIVCFGMKTMLPHSARFYVGHGCIEI